MSLEEWAFSHGAWKILELGAEKAISRWKARKVAPNWVERINSHFQGEVEIYCQNAYEPQIEIAGAYPLTEHQKNIAVTERRRLKSMNRPNDLHAVLVDQPEWRCDPPQLRAQVLDFGAVCALRKEDLRPPIFSSSAVIVCRKAKVLLLHERGKNIDTFPEYIHTLGGAYIPPGVGVDSDRSGLRSTVEREVHEEAQITLSGDDFPPMMMAREIRTGFIQLVFLGFGVKPTTLTRLEGNWEGKPLRIPFAQLPALLQAPKWVPTGKAHVLAWLALGAPNAGSQPRFGKLSPLQLFETIIRA